MRLIFSETKHLRLQFEHKNEAILIRIESDMIFLKLALYAVTAVTGKPNFTCSSLSSIFTFRLRLVRLKLIFGNQFPENRAFGCAVKFGQTENIFSLTGK